MPRMRRVARNTYVAEEQPTRRLQAQETVTRGTGSYSTLEHFVQHHTPLFPPVNVDLLAFLVGLEAKVMVVSYQLGYLLHQGKGEREREGGRHGTI